MHFIPPIILSWKAGQIKQVSKVTKENLFATLARKLPIVAMLEKFNVHIRKIPFHFDHCNLNKIASMEVEDPFPANPRNRNLRIRNICEHTSKQSKH